MDKHFDKIIEDNGFYLAFKVELNRLRSQRQKMCSLRFEIVEPKYDWVKTLADYHVHCMVNGTDIGCGTLGAIPVNGFTKKQIYLNLEMLAEYLNECWDLELLKSRLNIKDKPNFLELRYLVKLKHARI